MQSSPSIHPPVRSMRRWRVLLLIGLVVTLARLTGQTPATAAGRGQPPRLGAAAPSTPQATPLAATTVVAWGDNYYGQTDVPAGLSGVVQVAADDHTVALKSDGTVVAWGRNDSGQTTVPAGLSEVVQVAAGNGHTIALKSDGTIVAWGDNIAVPAGLSGVVQVAVGFLHTVALKSDGSVAAWGNNSYDQLDVPVGLRGVVQVAAGYDHTVALIAQPPVYLPLITR